LLRALIAREIDPVGMGSGVICVLLLFSVQRQVRHGMSAEVGALAVLVITIVIFASLSWVSDGFRGSVIFAAPMIPLLASLMLGKRAARNTTVIISAFLLFVLTQHMAGTLRPDETFPEEIRYVMRALILILSLVGMNWIASYYALMEQAAARPVGEDDEIHDALTGLLKREAIQDAIEREYARARRAEKWFSFALMEIDGFAALQAEHGVEAAENVVLGVADALRYAMRRSSDDLGRFADHQLCLLLNETGPSAPRAGEKFRSMIETLDIPYDGENTVRVSLSIGVCSAPARSAVGAEAILEGAQQALEVARAAGGNCVERLELAAASVAETD